MGSFSSAFPDFGRILEHGTNLFLIHSIHCCLIDSESDEALTMICLTATPRGSALSRTGQMRLHELSFRAHIRMEFDQGNPRRGAGNRLSRASGQPELWRESILEEEVIPTKSGILERSASLSLFRQVCECSIWKLVESKDRNRHVIVVACLRWMHDISREGALSRWSLDLKPGA